MTKDVKLFVVHPMLIDSSPCLFIMHGLIRLDRYWITGINNHLFYSTELKENRTFARLYLKMSYVDNAFARLFPENILTFARHHLGPRKGRKVASYTSLYVFKLRRMFLYTFSEAPNTFSHSLTKSVNALQVK